MKKKSDVEDISEIGQAKIWQVDVVDAIPPHNTHTHIRIRTV